MVFDIKTERELRLEEIPDLIKKYIEEKKWVIAAYYTRLLARELSEKMMRERMKK